MRSSLPDGDAPFVATLRPLFVDNDLMLLREMSRPKGGGIDAGPVTRNRRDEARQQHQRQQSSSSSSRQSSRHQHRKSHLASIATSGSQLRRRRGERGGGRKTAEREAATERLKQSTRDTLNIWSLGPRAQALSSWPDASEKLQPVVTEGVKWLLNGTLLLGPYPFARSFKGARPSYELLSRLISIGVCGPTTIMRFSTATHHSL